ncbi:MAG: hypothetical protein KKB50_08625 [Planctomycetes bacterium]|nr:hypothetical protein [Planctomycetota bacterium]
MATVLLGVVLPVGACETREAAESTAGPASAPLAQQAPARERQAYPLRWVFLETNLQVDRETDQAVHLLREAGRLGLNGVVVSDSKFFRLESAGLDTPGSPYQRNVERFLRAARAAEIEVIPVVPAVSMAEGILAYDVNLAAGYPVRDAVFEVHEGVARLVPDPQATLVNGGFEQTDGVRFSGWPLQDRAGVATLPERELARSGRQALRLDPVITAARGPCRVAQRVKVTPQRCYRISVWVQTAELRPAGAFQIAVQSAAPEDGRRLLYQSFEETVKPTQRWRRVDAVFNSLDSTEVNVLFGVWQARVGRAWLDDAELTELGLVNVLRRPGCPLTVRSADGRVTYVEGQDFEPVIDGRLGLAKGWAGSYDRLHTPATLRLRRPLPDGTRLLVSYYHPQVIERQQVDCCLSEDKVYEIFERAFVRMHGFLGEPRRYLLNVSELRTGGSCAACQATGKTPGELLAASVRRMAGIVRRVRADVQLYVWHDMFEPEANAHDDYYLVNGTLAGSWEGLDREIVVIPWKYETRERTLKFFAGRGHEQLVSANFDQVTSASAYLDKWLTSMDATPGVLGIMYTTWHGRYRRLEEFSRALSTRR